jgi:hypothetical protein
LAAEQINMTDVPVVQLAHLSDADKRAYILADNKLAMNAGDGCLICLISLLEGSLWPLPAIRHNQGRGTGAVQ